MTKTVAIIQARMGSTRLPGKVLKEIEGHPLLWYVLTRVQRATMLDQVMIATSTNPADDDIEVFCQDHGIQIYRGSEDDVLDRYFQAALMVEADVIVRITADCPLIDPDVLDQVVAKFGTGDFDYVSNTSDRTYPDGLDIEVFSREALERAWKEAHLKSEREHVTPYIWKHPNLFKIGQLTQEQDLSDLRWTVDEPQDLEFVRAVYQRLDTAAFGMTDVVELLARVPSLKAVNAGIGTNEGYQKSLEEDTLADDRGSR